MFPFLGISEFLKASCQEEDLAPSEQMGALPFTSVEFKCHCKGWVVPMGLISSQYIDLRGDVWVCIPWSMQLNQCPPPHASNQNSSGYCIAAVVRLDRFLFFFLSLSICAEKLILIFSRSDLFSMASPPTHVRLLPVFLPASRTLPFSRQF